MTEKTYGEILADLVAKHGYEGRASHVRWTRIGKGARSNAAWMIGYKYI